MHTGYTLPPLICATPLKFKPNQLQAGARQHAGTDTKLNVCLALIGRMYYPVW